MADSCTRPINDQQHGLIAESDDQTNIQPQLQQQIAKLIDNDTLSDANDELVQEAAAAISLQEDATCVEQAIVVKSANSAPFVVDLPSEGEDLEDGEIDDDDDDCDTEKDNGVASIVLKSPMDAVLVAHDAKKSSQQQRDELLVTIDLSHDEPKAPNVGATHIQPAKSKKPQPVEDDHASSIEYAIASALKKKGIEPPRPKLLESRSGVATVDGNEVVPGQASSSRSSRRRKRKKQRDEKEKERKERKRQRYESPNDDLGPPLPDVDDDLEESEMMNVRGGSPPPGGHIVAPPSNNHPMQYDSVDESGTSSYDSYDSASYEQAVGSGAATMADGGGGVGRRKRRGKKEARKRRERAGGGGRNREDDRNGRQDKQRKQRRDSEDDKHRQEPRKLELCKFYLMECCAKKDKCSYMHSDFPCKYYYLGMECLHDACKFSHGEPLTEQMRNILLKHLETAPKEILGNFKRISRDAAIAQMSTRHEELCKDRGVANTWSNSPIPSMAQHRRDLMHQQQQQQQQQLHQQQQPGSIPSLFDIKFQTPLLSGAATRGIGGSGQSEVVALAAALKADKRKSRWTNDLCGDYGGGNRTGLNKTPLNGPSYWELKNLAGILSNDQIEKLSQLDIVNLEEVNELTVGQLKQIGLSIPELSEILMKAKNLTDAQNTKATELERSGKGTSPAKSMPAATVAAAKEKKSDVGSSSNIAPFDYTQYLKDSQPFDRSFSYDDEKDEEQLVIDDDNMDSDDNATALLSPGAAPKLASTMEEVSESFAGRVHFPSGAASGNRNPFAKRTETERFDDSAFNVSRERDRERSCTPTESQSCTPEASLSPNPEYQGEIVYERETMYDRTRDDEENICSGSMKADKDMRYLPGDGELGGLPFTPNKNPIATVIDGSKASNPHIPYKVFEVEVPSVSYTKLRLSQNTSFDQTKDPRLRRIRGLPELSRTAISASTRTIASPESDGASPKYTPPTATTTSTFSSNNNNSANAGTVSMDSAKQTKAPSSGVLPRLDPRRAAAAAAAIAAAAANAKNSTSTVLASTSSSGNMRAIEEITKMNNLLEKSVWYKNLKSSEKIDVNQNLASLAAELKKFHQDTAPHKVFDVNRIICDNKQLQSTLRNLQIYFDDQGLSHTELHSNVIGGCAVEQAQFLQNQSSAYPYGMANNLYRQPPMVQCVDSMVYMSGNPQNPFSGPGGGGMTVPPPFQGSRSSLLGHPRPFTFDPSIAPPNSFMAGPFGGPPPRFGGFNDGMQPNMAQRGGFNNSQRNQNRHQQNRRRT